ncbi:hypothetical protein LZD49_27180 [Dyadobacter sp. CY261]|uniref:hypothetical protein n=1 Tax=Dyadobacter sp. CY261 TaxID=2907203 RepID=UPI001F18B387|nr:hypothetical protein [Dyadobacter sp. CY261]MCF0074197.1 hypothetical protein [Dyadobacter sp. CY261]
MALVGPRSTAHRYQIRAAPPAPPTPGAVFAPMPAGQGVDDGVSERMKAEKSQRKDRQ